MNCETQAGFKLPRYQQKLAERTQERHSTGTVVARITRLWSVFLAVLVESFLVWANFRSLLAVVLQILGDFGFLGLSAVADFFTEGLAAAFLSLFLAFAGWFSAVAVLDSVAMGTVAACTGAGLAVVFTFSAVFADCTGLAAALGPAAEGLASRGVVAGGGTSR